MNTRENAPKTSKSIIIAIAIIITSILFLFFFLYSTQDKKTLKKTNISYECAKNGGKWLEEHKECESISKNWCKNKKGNFKECESACRHDPEAQICTMQCVPVCDFKERTINYNSSPQNLTFTIEGSEVTLSNGYAEELITPDSSSKKITKIFDSKNLDINNDGLEDVILLLTQSTGGSGTFYYASAALNSPQGYFGLNSIYIGDRISPQTINFKDGIINYNYTTRYPWEAFTSRNNVAKTKYLKIINNRLEQPKTKMLSQEEAKKIAINKWGECGNDCGNLKINILDGVDNIWYIEAIYSDLLDDSIKSKKNTIMIFDSNGSWFSSEERPTQYICQENRGQNEFKETYCK